MQDDSQTPPAIALIERMNALYRRRAAAFVRYRWLVIAATVAATVVMAVGALRVRRDRSFESWLLENDPLAAARESFEHEFGNTDYVVVLFEADDVFSHDALAAIRDLGDSLAERVPFVSGVTSLAEIALARPGPLGLRASKLVPRDIPTDPLALEDIRRLALSRPLLVDRLFSADSRQAVVLLRLARYPDDGRTEGEHEDQVYRAVRSVLDGEARGPFRVHAGGMPILNAQKDEWLDRENPLLFGLTLLAMIAVLAVLFRSVRCVLAPLLTAFVACVWVFGVMGYAHILVQSMVEMIPVVLVLVVSIGYSIHVLSFFRQRFRKTGKRRESIIYAVENSGWPILFTVITTVLGLVSFAVVRVPAVRWIGLSSAGLVLATYPLVVVLTPAIMSFGGDREPDRTYVESGGRVEALLVRLAEWVHGHGRGIIVVFGVAVAASALVTTRLEVTTDSIKTIGRRVPYVENAYYIAERLGSLYAYDVAIEFPEDGGARGLANLERLDALARFVAEAPQVKRTMSLVDIVKDLNQSAAGGDPAEYRLPSTESGLKRLLLLYGQAGSPGMASWIDGDYRTLRLSVELARFSTAEMIPHVRSVAERARELFPGATVTLSGLSVQLTLLVDYIVTGQILSILAALIMIGIFLMIALGGVRLGLLAMIPNAAPIVFVTGTMAALGIPLHQATVVIAPMILGIAVDDTIHYITHMRLAFHRTGSYLEASRRTFRSVGKAIFMTSAVIVIGFGVLTTSIANVYKHVGLVTIVGITTALLADYFVTPTLIRWSRAFGPERPPAEGSGSR
jgi:hydrophobe/amphiphile efflux-3 (HAE3) family protein